MKKSIKAAVVASTLSALALVPAAAVVTVVSVDTAYAKGGNGNGGGNGGGNGKSSEARGQSKDSASRGGGGKPSWAGNGGQAGKSPNRGGPDPVGNFLKKLSGQDRTEARQASRSAPTKRAPETSVSPPKKPARFSDMHPRDLGNMNGALNANINAVLAHVRNGNTNGPVGHLALLAVADAGLAEAKTTLALAEDFDRLDAALDAAGYRSIEDYYAALEAGTVLVGDEKFGDLNDAIAALGGDAATQLDIGVQEPTEEEFASATEALPDLEAAQLEAEQKILDYWNKNPGALDADAAATAEVEVEADAEETLPAYTEAEDELLEDLRDRLVGYESDFADAIASPTTDSGDDVAECAVPDACEPVEDLALAD